MPKTTKSTRRKQPDSQVVTDTPPEQITGSLISAPPVHLEMLTALKALLPPYDQFENSRNNFARLLRNIFKCEAVSCFLVARAIEGDGKMELQIFSHDGYKSTPRSYKLGTGTVFLTTHVFEGIRKTFNQSATFIHDPKNRVPCSNRCESYLNSQRFDNILAVPFRTAEGRYAGILKFENRQGRNNTEPFPENDVAMAEDLARLVGLLVGHRTYSSLWVAWAKQEEKSLQTFVEILARHAPAECASVFVRKDGVLKNSGGVGYKLAYKDHQYHLPASEAEKPAHLTTWVAENGAVRKTITELQAAKELGMPFSNACEEYIGSPLRNLLAIPVEKDGTTVAVVKLENKLPFDTHFDELDEAIYAEFSNYVVNSLLPSKKRNKSHLPGVQHLLETVGHQPEVGLYNLQRESYYKQILDTQQVHLQKPEIVTIDVIESYLGIARNTWYKRLKEAQAHSVSRQTEANKRQKRT